MVSRKTFITILSVAALGTASVCTIESAKGGILRKVAADEASYTLTLDNSATFASNAATINTTNGNPIVFTSSSGSLTLAANDTLVNTTKISGIAFVQVTLASGAVNFTYDWNSAISRAFDGGSLSASGIVTFNDDKPSYFKMTATAATTITSLVVTYSCHDTENKTLHITDYAGLRAIGDHLDYNYVLDNDIDCGGKGFWVDGTYATAIDTFTGKLDGQGHVVSNLWLDGGWNNGFIKTLKGTVQNIAFKNMFSGSSPYSWGFFGTVSDGAVVNNVYLDLALTSDGTASAWEFQGGLVGIATICTISNCVVNLRTNTSTVTSYPYTASLVGNVGSWSTSMKHCYAMINGLALCANGTYYQEALSGVAAGMVNCANYNDYVALKAAAEVSTFSSTYWTFGASSLTFGSTVVI